MKKINGSFVLSNTDKKKALAHLRTMARSKRGDYDGSIGCWFDTESGKFYYLESVGSSIDYFVDDCMVCLGVADVYRN